MFRPRLWQWQLVSDRGIKSVPCHLLTVLFRIIDCARDFPHCTAVAVDLVPMQSLYANLNLHLSFALISALAQCLRIAGRNHSQAPSHAAIHPLFRFRSEVDDINLGLEHFYGDFNVVHAQLIASGVSSISPIDLISA